MNFNINHDYIFNFQLGKKWVSKQWAKIYESNVG